MGIVKNTRLGSPVRMTSTPLHRGPKILRMRLVGYLLAAMAVAGLSHANVYKCVSPSGVVTFSDEPCADDAVVFVKEPHLSIDDTVRQASPFADLTLDSKAIDNALLAHAKKMGKCILPDESFNAYTMRGGERRRHRYPEWEIELAYGPKGDLTKWRITLKYAVRTKGEVLRIWLTNVYVRLTGTYFDVPSMPQAATLVRKRQGQWQVAWW